MFSFNSILSLNPYKPVYDISTENKAVMPKCVVAKSKALEKRYVCTFPFFLEPSS